MDIHKRSVHRRSRGKYVVQIEMQEMDEFCRIKLGP